MNVCPCCGSVVPEGALPEEVDIADLRDRFPMMPLPALLFLILWNAGGRTVPYEQIADEFERRTGGISSRESVRDARKRLGYAIAEHKIPVKILQQYSTGYSLARPKGWRWRDAPLAALNVEDEFIFKG